VTKIPASQYSKSGLVTYGEKFSTDQKLSFIRAVHFITLVWAGYKLRLNDSITRGEPHWFLLWWIW